MAKTTKRKLKKQDDAQTTYSYVTEKGTRTREQNPADVVLPFTIKFENKFTTNPTLSVGIQEFQVAAHGGSGVVVAQVRVEALRTTGFDCTIYANISKDGFGWVNSATIEYTAWGMIGDRKTKLVKQKIK